jgi:glycosyltransferase involved in cell wall biosynthesis
MRVVMIGPFGLRPKGTMIVRALPMAKALVARGHSVTMLLPPWSYPQDSGRVEDIGGVRIENIALPPRRPIAFHLLATRRLVGRALALKPDVVHCFKPKAYAGLSAWAIWHIQRLRGARARLVVDEDDWEGAGGWNERENYSWAQKRAFAWQERWGLQHCDAVTVASRTLESIAWSMGVSRAKTFYVPNGPGLEIGDWRLETRESSSNLQSRFSNLDSPTVLLYSRFFEFKYDRVLEVFGRVLNSVPEARLLLIGKGLFGDDDKLMAEARGRGWGDRVSNKGWIAPEDLPQALARADVAIYPFDDTLLNRTKCPVKLVDLLTVGVPVVADDVGQIGEYIRHHETGWLVPSGDVQAMADAVIELLQNRDRARRLGEAAAIDARARFSWDRLVEVVEQAYQR